MITTHNLGFPRIGRHRELKKALEAYWKGNTDSQTLLETAANLRKEHWACQASLNWVPVGDFSFYDQMLDMSFTLGCLPKRAQQHHGQTIDNYFRVARGRTSPHCCSDNIAAGEMTKWFDTNYHYIVPEFSQQTSFSLDTSRLKEQWGEAQAQGINAKPVIIGPVTYLYLGKSHDGIDRLDLLPQLLDTYANLLLELQALGAEWVQIDEPALVLDLDETWRQAFNTAYHQLKTIPVKILLTTYFDGLEENRYLAANLPVAGLHVDAVRGKNDITPLLNILPSSKILSLGIIDGRNIWKTDLNALLDWLEPIANKLGDRLWIAPSCSLLHVPVDLAEETTLSPILRSWLAFAQQKLEEIHIIGKALNQGRQSVQADLEENRIALESRRHSSIIHRPEVQQALSQWQPQMGQRQSPYETRIKIQQERLNLPLLPTTTIGSFPQTDTIRQARQRYKKGEILLAEYEQAMQDEILDCVNKQHTLDLDVLVHGEAERNDMVEYFGEQLEGYAFSKNGWVQSYGSRCVKPPILFGDVKRDHPMTVKWSRFAQSVSHKPMKGMLTGPVTILNWSFVRDDQPREISCRQLALAIRGEVQDLEAAGIQIIQIDEPALREGLPLKQKNQAAYLNWAVDCFRVASNGVQDSTQIHTHMCYSEFNDIIQHIAALDADVITIETARSAMELLNAFEAFNYPNEIGPGVYDIHSPNQPEIAKMVELIERAAQRIPIQKLWINPDCGLKTRQWSEVIPALENMVKAAKQLRQQYQNQ